MDARKNYLTMKAATDLFRKTIPPEIMKDLLLDNVEVKFEHKCYGNIYFSRMSVVASLIKKGKGKIFKFHKCKRGFKLLP